MKNFISLLLGLLIAFMQAAPCFAQAARSLVRLKNAAVTAEAFGRTARVSNVLLHRPVLLPMGLLPAAKPSLPTGTSTLSAQVARRVADKSKKVDITELSLTQPQVFEIVRNFKTAAALEQPKLYSNVLPYLTVARNFTVRRADWLAALTYYRTTLLTSLKQPSATPNAWGRDMAAVSNLGLFGTRQDGALILNIAHTAPENFTAYTDVIAARALLGIQAYEELQELIKLRTEDGELPAHWAGIAQYAQEEGLPLEFAPVNEAAVAPALTNPAQTSLAEWNQLNLFHTRLSAEDTRSWLAQRQVARANITADEIPAAAIPSAPETAAEIKQTVLAEKSAPQHADEPETAYAAQAPPAAEAPFRHHFFEDPTGRLGPLAIFCKTQNIDYQNKTLAEITHFISTDSQAHDAFIAMVKNNGSDLVSRLIKGLRTADYQTLKTAYPPAAETEEFSAQLGEDILGLLNAITVAPQAQTLRSLLNNSYFFISHFRGQKIYLGTEFNSAELPILSEKIKDYNRANGIGRTDFIGTFSPAVGRTSAVNTNPEVTVEPNRLFIFEGFNGDIHFEDLPSFLQRHPSAALKGTSFRQRKDIVFTNPKTQQTIFKPGILKLKQEPLDEDLRALENVLRGSDTRAVLLLDGESAEQNFRFMFERLDELKPYVKQLLSQKLGDEKISVSYRFGEHEIEGKGNLVPMANMHMHLEAYIPSLRFTYNVSIPLRVSEKAKADIWAKFQEWEAKGRPKGSPIDYYGEPSLWERLSQRAKRYASPEAAPQTSAQTPAAAYPEMYDEGEFIFAF